MPPEQALTSTSHADKKHFQSRGYLEYLTAVAVAADLAAALAAICDA